MSALLKSETLSVPAPMARPPATCARTVNPVVGARWGTARDERSRADEEARLTCQAIAGDGTAFATLYSRYERRVYNLCYRILGSADDAADATQEAFLGLFGRLPKLADRELNFGSYLFMSARNASYDIVKRRGSASPTSEIPESAAPVGPGAGGDGGSDPGRPEDDPERNVLLAAQQQEVRAANASLPERQREVLALREVAGMSYDEIADIMGMNRNSVAQLISRARIGLRDALRSTALASVAAATPECERALPLIALGHDRQPRERADARWLKAHLAACDSCRVSREAMAEAGGSYRAWVPVAAAPWLFDETVAKAAELIDTDWKDVSARGRPAGESTGAATGSGFAARTSRVLASAGSRRRRTGLATALAALLVVIVFAGTTHDGTPAEDEAVTGAPAGQVVPAGEAGPATSRERRNSAAERQAAGTIPALGIPALGVRARASGRKRARPGTENERTTRPDPVETTNDSPVGTTDPPVVPPVPPEQPPQEDPPRRGIPPVFVAPPPPPRRCGLPGTPRCPRVPVP